MRASRDTPEAGHVAKLWPVTERRGAAVWPSAGESRSLFLLLPEPGTQMRRLRLRQPFLSVKVIFDRRAM